MATTLILGGELPAPRDVVEAVHERTNGIPLHIEELLAALDDDARADGRLIRDAHVPDTIGDAVLARLERLSADAREVVQAGAVIGRCFTPDVLAGVMDRPLAELEPALQELEDAAIIYPFQYIDHGYYDFRHQLLRDAIYDTRPAVPASAIPCSGRRVRDEPRGFERRACLAPLRACRFAAAGLPYLDDRSGRGKPNLSTAGGVRALSARNREHAHDLPVVEQAQLFEQYSDAAAAIEHNEDAEMAAIRARQLYLEAGRPIDAATQHLAMFSVALRRGEPTEHLRTYLDQASAEIADLPASPERETLRAWLHPDGSRAPVPGA